VRMRSRKPWVLARRRLFGWKVRLLTRGLQDAQDGSDHPRGRGASPDQRTGTTPRWACGSGQGQLDLATVRAGATEGQTTTSDGTSMPFWRGVTHSLWTAT
jgi:hypothetical protein